jgi:hypothetical protein
MFKEYRVGEQSSAHPALVSGVQKSCVNTVHVSIL